tara:strand:+ start:1108 stop:1353 length:246 start_codon:yes stop_codon:yes gene_type:complete
MTHVYIVFTYNIERSHGTREKIIGTYLNLDDAINRVKTFGESPYKYSPGVYYTKDGFVTFINNLPLGDSIEIDLFSSRVDF